MLFFADVSIFARPPFNTLASARIRGFLEKKTPKRTWICAGISLVRYALQTQ